MPEFYAHSVEGKPKSEWQGLEAHLSNVAELTKKFWDKFGSREWAYLAGLWHEMGEVFRGFLKYIPAKITIFTV